MSITNVSKASYFNEEGSEKWWVMDKLLGEVYGPNDVIQNITAADLIDASKTQNRFVVVYESKGTGNG